MKGVLRISPILVTTVFDVPGVRVSCKFVYLRDSYVTFSSKFLFTSVHVSRPQPLFLGNLKYSDV